MPVRVIGIRKKPSHLRNQASIRCLATESGNGFFADLVPVSHDLHEPSINIPEHDDDGYGQSGEHDEELHEIGPDHRANAAHHGVQGDDCSDHHDERDGTDLIPGHHRQGKRRNVERRGQPTQAPEDKYTGGQGADTNTESAFQVLVGRDHAHSSVKRQGDKEHVGIEQQPGKVPHHRVHAELDHGGGLQKVVDAAVQGRHERRAHHKPTHLTPGQEEIGQVALAPEMEGTDQDQHRQVGNDDQDIQPMKSQVSGVGHDGPSVSEAVLKVLKRVAEIDLGRWARRGRGARARRPWSSFPNAGHDPKQLCPKGLDRNDPGAAFHPKGIALWGYPVWDVPCATAFSVQTTHFITFKTASQKAVNSSTVATQRATALSSSHSFVTSMPKPGASFGTRYPSLMTAVPGRSDL